jgi:S-(hydroxymethyl)glutathione dehydrogenase/alcohol dehydrogenase
MKAAVWTGERLVVVDDLTLRPLEAGEVKVRVLASGLCHSDLNKMDAPGVRTPVVLGHEAAGVVAELGPGVDGVALGERVMVCSQTPCGRCRECARDAPANCDETWGFAAPPPFVWKGRPVHSFANISSFAEEIIVRRDQVFPTHELPFAQAALIGCAVATGYGAVRHLAQVGAGDRVAVLGVGGIGVNAIRAAKLHGAEQVVAVDSNPLKEEVARRFGADAFVLAGEAAAHGLAAAAPIDTVLECSGAAAARALAFAAVKRGGRVVLVGMTGPGARLDLDLSSLMRGCSVVSTLQGGARRDDFPHLVERARRGDIDLAAQVTRIWPLAEIEAAVAALRAGAVTRAVLSLSDGPVDQPANGGRARPGGATSAGEGAASS